jgi:periplasmic divalent cation tolerance protein
MERFLQVTENNALIEVTTTTATVQEAHAIAGHLVAQRLAACVQVAGPIRSFYRWQGELCEADEFRLTIKSLASHQSQVMQAIESLHSYDTPEIIVSPIAACSPKYADWWREQI